MDKKLQVPSILSGNRVVDDRGSLSFINDFDVEEKHIRRFYIVKNHAPMFIRAWHGHASEEKYAMVLEGTAMVLIIPLEEARRYEIHDSIIGTPIYYKYILDASQPSMLHVPAGYIHGSMTFTADTKIIFYSTSTLEESKNDDIRFPSSMWENLWRIEKR